MNVLHELFNNKELADLEIVIKENDEECKTFYANRAIFAAKSEIFKTMFFGKSTMIESSLNGNLVIEDISIEAFECFMKEIYDLHFEIKQNNVAELWYSAKKYMMMGLQQKCIEYVQNVSDLDEFMNTLKYIPSVGLMDDLLILFKDKVVGLSHGTKLLNHTLFLELHQDVIMVLISNDHLLSDEHLIWERCIEWSKKNTLISNDDDNKKDVQDTKIDDEWRVNMKQFVPYIRFNNMEIQYFLNNIASSNVLSDSDQKEIAFNFLDTKFKTRFNQNHRWIDYISVRCVKILKSLSDKSKNVEFKASQICWKDSYDLGNYGKFKFSFEVRKICGHLLSFGINTDEYCKSYSISVYDPKVGTYSFSLGKDYSYSHSISFSQPTGSALYGQCDKTMRIAQKCKEAYPVITICSNKQCQHKNEIVINHDFT